MNKAKHVFFAAGLLLALSLSSCTTESAELPPPPSSDSQGGLSSSVIEAQSSSSDLAPSSSSVLPSSSGVAPSSSSGGGTSGTFTDSRNSQTYNWVKIGDQIWMAENLNYEVSGSVCYDNSSSNCSAYGRLYDWNTALSTCPSGWHLPSSAEWSALTSYVENSNGCASCAGSYLKTTSDWNTGHGYIAGTDDYGFSALPGGYGLSDGSFRYVGFNGYWWSSSEYDASYAYFRYMDYSYEYVYRDYYDKSRLFSVRCVKD